ncbi:MULTISPECIES: hypothetical protein [Deinococcus]|uniref:Uncharacterized protein n=1 Tax=Deinococcus rufus TaxID=2136097 RepID=A0ABV7ZCE6_9DEIO|nr:hypothetical protein [Deinococcus sp. AB2017081]WQE94081.1 hypothetical protein U2P90_11745 [Deinococcus sp. AB2017081]
MTRKGVKKPAASKSATSGSGKTPASAENLSSTVREFIYLDEGRVFSYLAQIEGGLRLLRHEVEGALDVASEETGGDGEGGSFNAEGGVSPTAAAIAGVLGGVAGFPVGLLAGLSGKAQYNTTWESSSPIVRTTNSDTVSRADLTILHHAAFDLVIEHMKGKIKTARGALTLLPVSALGGAVASLQGLEIEALSNPSAVAGVAAIAAMSGFGVQTFVFLESPNNLHAMVEDKHFTMPPSLFASTYGSCTSIPFSVAYIEAQDTRKARVHVPKQFATPAAKRQFSDLVDIFGTLTNSLGMGDGTRIFPLAIYRDL